MFYKIVISILSSYLACCLAIEDFKNSGPKLEPLQVTVNRARVEDGVELEIHCRADGGTKPLFFEWSIDGEPVKVKPDYNLHVVNYESNSTLTLNMVFSQSADNYTCAVRNEFGTRRASVILSLHGENITADNVCDSWSSYKDEKCYFLAKSAGQQSYAEAKEVCEKLNGTPASIHSQVEQDFITKLVFVTNKVEDEVWLGAHRDNKIMKWANGDKYDELDYTNWAPNNPTNVAGNDCLQMMPKDNEQGKWDDCNCTKRNMVLCQKMQVWTTDMIQETLLQQRKDYQKQQELIDQLSQQVVPINYTYVQLPAMQEPHQLWPAMKWKEISANYAGVFFRVAGGTAAAFGQTQEETCPRLTTVELTDATKYLDKNPPIAKGGFAKIKAGSTGAPWYFQFDIANAEVRPRNMAVRVWKRVD